MLSFHKYLSLKIASHTSVSLICWNNKLYSGFSNGTIGVWDEHENFLQILHGHTEWVGCLCVWNNFLLCSGSDDRTIRMWNSVGISIHILNAHSSSIRDLIEWDHMLCSCSEDKTIKVWDTSGQCHQTLQGHTDWVICLAVWQDNLCSGSLDNTIRIWNHQSQVIQVLEGPNVSCLCIWNSHLYAGGHSDIKVWEYSTWNCIHTIKAHTLTVTCLLTYGDYLLSSSDDGFIGVWNPVGKCVQMLEEGSEIYDLAIWNDKLLSGCYKNIGKWIAM